MKLEELIKAAKVHKQMWVEATERGDLTPTIFAEKDDKLICVVIAPQVDKEMCFQAAAMLKRGLNCDSFAIIMDAHIKLAKKDESEEEFLKHLKPGELQRQCDEEGACERGEISDCLLCYTVDKEGNMTMSNITYSYHGKGGTPFKWTDNEEYRTLDDKEEGVRVEGNIPYAMKQIMKLQPLLDDNTLAADFEEFLEENTTLRDVAKSLKLSDKQQQYHTARALFSVLSGQGYIVMDAMQHNLPYEQWLEENFENQNANEEIKV